MGLFQILILYIYFFRNHKVRYQGAIQDQDLSTASTSFDCRDNAKHQEKEEDDLEHRQSQYRKSLVVEMFNKGKTSDPSKNKGKPKTPQLLNSQFGMFTCIECSYQTNYKLNLERHNLQHKESGNLQVMESD